MTLEIWAATTTPFTPTGELDVSVVPEQAARLRTDGVDGAFVAGTTGEFPALTASERRELLAAWAEHGDGLRLAAHVGHTDLSIAQELAAHAEELGVEMISSLVPYYGNARIDATVGWLADVAEAAPRTPFTLYHIPHMTGSTLRPSSLLRASLERIETLRGVKFTDPDLMEFAATAAVAPHIRMYYGCDELLPAALSFGAEAVIGSLYNVLAPVARQVAAALSDGHLAEAYELHTPLREVAVAAGANGGVGFLKELMNRLGPDAGPCRSPWGPIGAEAGRVADELAARLEQGARGRALPVGTPS